MSGARISELVVNHRARKFGTSKYGISRTLKVLADMCSLKLITRFCWKPMVGFFALALPFAGLGFVELSALRFGSFGGSGRQHGSARRNRCNLVRHLVLFCSLGIGWRNGASGPTG